MTGLPAHGFLDPLKGWGGFGMYFLTDRAGPYVKHPDDPAFLFDIDTMKPRINNPGWVQAIQDVMDLIAIEGAYPADQINADPGTTGFQQFLAGTGSMLTWWGDIGSNARTSDTSVIGDVVGFSAIPGSDRVYNHNKGAWENTYNEAPNNAYLGWGVYVTNRVEGDAKKERPHGRQQLILEEKIFLFGLLLILRVSSHTEILTLTTMSGKQLVMTALLWKTI